MGRVDRRLDRAQAIAQKFSPKVAKLLGLKGGLPDYINAGNLSKGVAGNASYGGGITFDRKFLRTADRKDFRGAVIHELTHTLDPRFNGNKGETRADYARFMLNPKETADWKPSHDVRAMARNRGDMAEYRGGKVGEGNRRREGQGNKESKKVPGAGGKSGGKALPAMTPAQNAAYYDQLSGLYQTYQNQLMQLRQERVGLRTAFKQERVDIRGEMIGGLSDSQNAGIERGLLGSSAQSQEEIGVRAEAEQARSAAKNVMLQGLAYNNISKAQAATDYFAGSAALRAQKLAQQQELLAMQLENNTMISASEDRRNREGPGGAGNKGGSGTSGGSGSFSPQREESIADRITREVKKESKLGLGVGVGAGLGLGAHLSPSERKKLEKKLAAISNRPTTYLTRRA